ncbi:MAG: helix-turn-helix domain-containing protein, partial [Thermoanaerobaculia bacterium]
MAQSIPSPGTWISASRRRLGWTQTELGRLLGVSQAQVSHWERGKSTPGDRERAEMERVFGQPREQPMTTSEFKSKVDRIWDTMWSGGISNPLSVIEQLTYLLFI